MNQTKLESVAFLHTHTHTPLLVELGYRSAPCAVVSHGGHDAPPAGLLGLGLQAEAPAQGRVSPLEPGHRLLQRLPLLLLPRLQDLLLFTPHLLLLPRHVGRELVGLLQLQELLGAGAVLRQTLLLLLQLLLDLMGERTRSKGGELNQHFLPFRVKTRSTGNSNTRK